MRRRSLSSVFLGLSNVSETLLPLIRGVVLARLLAPDQFGLAVTITIVASIAEFVSELGVNQMALRTGLGANLGTLQSLAVVRGLVLGALIALSGPLFGAVFKAPETAWIYSIAGLASAIRGFTHLEIKACMRDYRYTPEAATIFTGQFIWTVGSIGAATVLPDYRAMIIGLVASAIGSVLVSHLVAKRRFFLEWDRKVLEEAMIYGRPLLLNGVALAIAGLGDRFLIGWRIGLGPLAQYTALASAAFLPRSAVTKFMVSLFTPQFINASSVDEQRKLADIWMIALSTLGGVFGIAFIGCGSTLIAFAFGSKYVIDQSLIDLVALLACIRYMATIPLAPSMAIGRTDLVLLNTAAAASGLLLAALMLLHSSTLDTLVKSMILGEGLALAWVLHRLRTFVTFTSHVWWVSLLLPNSIIALIAVGLRCVPHVSNTGRMMACALFIFALLLCQTLLLRLSENDILEVFRRLFPKHLGSKMPSV